MFTGFSLQTYFSIQHLQAAAYFSRQALASELRLGQGYDPGTSRVEIKANATSAVFLSVAFLEALANELFADSLKTNGDHLEPLSHTGRSLISEFAEDESIERASVITKFNLLLKAAGKGPIGRGELPSQDVATVIRLRNNLIHYKASWLDVGTLGMTRPGNLMGSKLQKAISGKFSNRAGANSSSGDAWLGGGCAKWSVQSTIAYTDTFFGKLGITPLYDHVRNNLGLE